LLHKTAHLLHKTAHLLHKTAENREEKIAYFGENRV